MTPTKQEMLKAIKEHIADKTLSFGCLIKHENIALRGECIVLGGGFPAKTHIYACYGRGMDDTMSDVGVPRDGLEIIGHPVMIGDVLDWYNEKRSKNRGGKVTSINISGESIRELRKDLRNPIDTQGKECIKFIYDLLPKA